MTGRLLTWALALGLRNELPTVDYYFLAALADRVSSPLARGKIDRLGPHTFACEGRLVVIRYATAEELSVLAGRKWNQVHYVIDDMLPIAGDCDELPASYRQRLRVFAREVLPRILDADPEVLTPRSETLELFPQHRGQLLDPAYLHLADDLAHFDGLEGQDPGRPVSIVRAAFLGTRSHGAGLDFLSEIADAINKSQLRLRLTVFLGSHIPPLLAKNPIVENRKPLSWPAFRRLLEKERFHLLLAPLPDTPFNKGRSITKLLDAAAVGAAGIYSNRLPFADRVTHGADGLLVGDNVENWLEAISGLAGNLERTRGIAAGGASLARRVGDPDRLRAFWQSRLAFEKELECS